MASADMIGRWKDVPASEMVVALLLLLLRAFVHVKLSPPRIIHFMAQEDITCGRRIWKMTVMVLAGLFHECPSGIATFSVRVDRPVVVCAGPVLSGSAEEQPSFIAIVATVTAAAAGRYGLPAAGVAVPLLLSTPAQENANERDHQKQTQEGANHGACQHASTERLFQGFCRKGDEGNRWRKRTKEAGIEGYLCGSLALFWERDRQRLSGGKVCCGDGFV